MKDVFKSTVQHGPGLDESLSRGSEELQSFARAISETTSFRTIGQQPAVDISRVAMLGVSDEDLQRIQTLEPGTMLYMDRDGRITPIKQP